MIRYILAVSIVLIAFACSPSSDTGSTSNSQGSLGGGTQAMIDSIHAIHARTDFRRHPYESGEKLKRVQQEIARAEEDGTLTAQQFVEYGLVLLDAGQSAQAVRVFEQIVAQYGQGGVVNESTKSLYEALAIAYLRTGEQENCLRNHSGEACILPIQGKGIHQWEDGSRKAIQVYLRILEAFPDDYRSRWLLNLGFMTLDEYPDKVPAKWVLPPEIFKPEYPVPVFKNVAMDLHLDVNNLAGGVIADDFNNDGLIDLVVSSWGMLDQIRFFRNQGDGTFQDLTESSGLIGLTGGLNLIQADYDNDGYLDFYIIRGAWRGLKWMGYLPNSLVRNNGDGTFSDVTISAGMYRHDPTQSAVWLDFNRDGWLDLFVGNETHTEQELHPCQLFVNLQDGTFRDIAPDLSLDITAYIKGVTTGDINNDDLPDLYISSLTSTNKLFINRGGSDLGHWRFEEKSQNAGVSEPVESFPTWFFDFNNDGLEDLFVSSFDTWSFKQQSNEVAADYLGKSYQTDQPRLYVNVGNERFVDQTEAVRLNRVLSTMGCNYGDLDNDGYLDFYLGTGAPDFRAVVPNRMFRNHQGRYFQDVTYGGNFGHIQKGHGIAFADFDNDGDQDIYAVMGGSMSGDIFQNALFENPGSGNKWITIVLKGKTSNRCAIGARVKVVVEEETGDERTIYNTVSSGGSFGANSLQLEIGLGEAKQIVAIEVDWPDGKPEYRNYGAVEMNQRIIIEEDADRPSSAPMQRLTFVSLSHHGQHN